MKKSLLRLSMLCLMMLVTMMAQAKTVTANWSWKTGVPATISNVKIEGSTGNVASDVDGIVLTVDATNGKLASNGDNAQMNAGTKIQVPVQSNNDVVTVVAHPYNFTTLNVGGTASSELTTTHTATASEAKQGYVLVEATVQTYLYSISVTQNIVEKLTEDRTGLWDFQNVNPSSLAGVTIQKATDEIVSTNENIVMFVDATNGKLAQRTSDAQFNAGTILRVPVLTSKDVVTVVSYPGQHNYTVGGVAATADETVYQAKANDVSNGYVEIVATGGSYLYSINVDQKSAFEEKPLYTTDFSDWDALDANKDAAVSVVKSTKYSNEELTFSLFGTRILKDQTGSEADKVGQANYARTEKGTQYNITTSALKNITKVHFINVGTSKNRGYKLFAKGDGDADWVLITDSMAQQGYAVDLTVDVNRTNCQLMWQNSQAQYAIVPLIEIFGKVETSSTPTLGSFKLNGTEYNAGDIFTEDADKNMVATVEISKQATIISEENPLTDVVAENGEVGTITYSVADNTTTVTIPVTLGEQTVNYILTVAQKQDFTLTYFDADGTTEIGTQEVEKDATIGEFKYTVSNVTVAEGKAFRGWAVSTQADSQKFTTADVITSNKNLYALVTDIEEVSDESTFYYNLGNKYFDMNDHELISTEGKGKFHDGQHGWDFTNGDKLSVQVSGNAMVTVGLCQYANGSDIVVTDAKGNVIDTFSSKASADGAGHVVSYNGEPTTLTFTFSGTAYFHNVEIRNLGDIVINKAENGWYIVEPNNATNFLVTLMTANSAASSEKNTVVFLPNGTYDLGSAALTTISGENLSIIGQSQDGVIIKNKPEAEGIGITATLFNASKNLYMQDITLKNDWDFTGKTGRAVCFQDKGSNTIGKNVTMLSYQDTYYSNNNNKTYWETSDIHGTVDYICGSGDVFFKNCTLTNEAEIKDVTMTAPNTDASCQYGYVFDGCKVVMKGSKNFNLGRCWDNAGKSVFLNTVFTPEAENAIIDTRWTLEGMNIVANNFFEYNTLNENGDVISPAEKILTFVYKTTQSTYNTILSAEEAQGYTLVKVMGEWAPNEIAAQVAAPEATLDNGTLSWNAVEGASAYLIEKDGEFVGITSETTYAVEGEGNFTVRAANARGGFGEAAAVATGLQNVVLGAENQDTLYNLAGQRVNKNYKGVVIANGVKKIQK